MITTPSRNRSAVNPHSVAAAIKGAWMVIVRVTPLAAPYGAVAGVTGRFTPLAA